MGWRAHRGNLAREVDVEAVVCLQVGLVQSDKAHATWECILELRVHCCVCVVVPVVADVAHLPGDGKIEKALMAAPRRCEGVLHLRATVARCRAQPPVCEVAGCLLGALGLDRNEAEVIPAVGEHLRRGGQLLRRKPHDHDAGEPAVVPHGLNADDAVVEVVTDKVAASVQGVRGRDVAPACNPGSMLVADVNCEPVPPALLDAHASWMLQVERQDGLWISIHLPVELKVRAIVKLVHLTMPETSISGR
mmetsp:Transcript_124584/g.387924  ORF Transcript_124584/g.387924 Transcript_124584/m.387924 type:complete len:249 (-) Transcript_124584:121-867(-)